MRHLNASWTVKSIAGSAALSMVLAGWCAGAIPDAAGKTGEFQVKLTERCALSSATDVAKRLGLDVSKPAPGGDYNLAKENFAVYVPKTPGPDGKYGLIVGLLPRTFGKPPAAWEPVLDKYNLVWVGPENNNDGSRDPVQRAGLVLDAVFNAQTTWQIDLARVFLFNAANDPPITAMAMYYPDVFDGTLQCNVVDFYYKVHDNKRFDNFSWGARIKKPGPDILEQAKTRRYFFIDNLADHYGESDQAAQVVTAGYEKSGFKNVKTFQLRTDIKMQYLQQPADWFDAGLAYLNVKPETPAVALAKGDAAPEPQTPAANARPAASTMPARETPKVANATPTLPANSKEPPKTTTPAATPPPPSPPPPVVETPEDKAQHALNAVKSYIAAQRYDIARTRLQKIISDYPDTTAAKDAKAMLKDIQDK